MIGFFICWKVYVVKFFLVCIFGMMEIFFIVNGLNWDFFIVIVLLICLYFWKVKVMFVFLFIIFNVLKIVFVIFIELIVFIFLLMIFDVEYLIKYIFFLLKKDIFFNLFNNIVKFFIKVYFF